jgi:hypothetical protein
MLAGGCDVVADGGGESSQRRSCTGSGLEGAGAAPNGTCPPRIDGGTRVGGNVLGTSLPERLP